MACTLIAIGEEECVVADGGIRVSYLAPCSDVADFTVAAGVVSAITMEAAGSFTKFVYDDDGTASYNQEGARTNNKHTLTQTAVQKFAGLDQPKVNAGNALIDCCCLVGVHFMNNGTAHVQGIEVGPSGTTWKLTRRKAKATVSGMSDTDENEDRLDVQIISQSRYLSPTTTLDEDAMDLL